MIGKTNKKITYRPEIFYILLACFVGVMGIFFARFVDYGDIPPHILSARTFFDEVRKGPSQIGAYPLFHVTVWALQRLLVFDYETITALLLTISALFSVLLFRVLMHEIIKERSAFDNYFCDLVSLGATVFMTVRSPLCGMRYYEGQGAANPQHNPTILYCRVFALASFILFVRFMEYYEAKKAYLAPAIGFGVMTFLSILAKPSYAIVFLEGMGLLTLIRMIKHKKLDVGIAAFLCVLPSVIFLAWQMVYVKGNSQMLNVETTITTGITYINTFTKQELFLSGLAVFPVVILLFRIKGLKENAGYMLAMVAFVVGWIQMYFFNNGPTGDFGWGYFLSVQVATVVALAYSRVYAPKKWWIRGINGIAYAVYAYQVLCGFKYIRILYLTGEFMY